MKVHKNFDKLAKPSENHAYSAHFVFSYGHLLLNAGYESNVNYVFHWEEPYQGYLAWKAGYTLYSPNEFVMWHLWDQDYRKRFESDLKQLKYE